MNHTVEIPMRDGVRLATDLYFPKAGDPPFPVVLIRTPYNKAWLQEYGTYFADAGYAVAIQDVRGRWSSGGDWEPFVHEGADGFDTVEWLGTREWSTGRVGMMGGSYSGTAQYLAAVERPPHLVTIVPAVTPAMPFDDIPRRGGAFAMGWALRWSDIMENARTGRELQSKLRESVNADWSGKLAGLPVIELDRTVAGGEVPYFRDWVRHGTGDAYWESMRYLPDLETLDIPVFLRSGWFDPGVRGTLLAFERLAPEESRRTRLLVGPWAHGDVGSRYLNGIDMGAAAQRDLWADYRRWFDLWLDDTGPTRSYRPAVEIYVMGANRWLTGDRYPPEGAEIRRLYLAAPSDRGRGRLAWERPVAETAFDSFTYDPSEPTPSFHAALKRGAVAAYRTRIDTGADALVYESDPLAEPLVLAGPVEMRLFASTSARDTDWTATLYALAPTGQVRVLGLTFGILRARNRESMTRPTAVQPGVVDTFRVDLGHTAVSVAPGERLRMEIASAAFPEYSRNLNTGGNDELETEWLRARQRVYRDSGRASHLLLPVLPDGR